MKQNSTSKCFLLEKGKCSNFKVIFLDMYILQIRPFAIWRPRSVIVQDQNNDKGFWFWISYTQRCRSAPALCTV